MGFFAYLPIPILNSLIAGAIMFFVGLPQQKKGGVAAQNGVNAANWALPLIAVPILFILVMVTGLLTGTKSPTGVTMQSGFDVALVVLGPTWLLLMIAHVIVTIMGTIRANRGGVFRAPALPVIKNLSE